MINELLEAKIITHREYNLYKLFNTEHGQECLDAMMQELFWEEPNEDLMSAGVLGFYEGRRSVIRSIKSTIQKVQGHINHEIEKEG